MNTKQLLAFVTILMFGDLAVGQIESSCWPKWLPGSSVPGTDSWIGRAILWDPDGDDGPADDWVVIGGDFHAVADTVARSVVAWDGSSWHEFGEGINGEVGSLAVWKGDLIVGGDFTEADARPIDTIARWDGQTWQPIGDNLHGTVYSLAIFDGDLIAAGRFVDDALEDQLVMRWDGNSWAPMGSVLSNNLVARSLTVVNGQLFVGGVFHHFGSQIFGIARWQGSEWASMGDTLGTNITTLGVHDQELIASGRIRINGNNLGGIARWDGTTWYPLGTGLSMNSGIDAVAFNMMDCADGLLVVGMFELAGGIPCANIAKWDGKSWSPFTDGFSDAANCVVRFRDNLIVGGIFRNAGNQPVNHLARWDGTAWNSLSPGIARSIWTLATFEDQVFAGGTFDIVGKIPAGRLAAWNGFEWTPIEHTFHRDVLSLCTYEGRLVASGRKQSDFTSSIQAWNGTEWEPLTLYMNSPARAMIQFGDDLIAIGDFGNINNILIADVARFDGSTWHQFGNGNLAVGGPLRAITVYNNQVVVGGGGNGPASHIVFWTGSSWQPVGGGVNQAVWALTTYQGELVAGGAFATAGGVPVNYIARWNGTQWLPLSGGANDHVKALGVHDGALFAAGQFTKIGGVQADGVARWDGLKWSPLGSGIPSGQVRAFASLKGEMTIGGEFGVAGGMVSSQFARWSSTGILWIAQQPQFLNASCIVNAQFTVAVATGYGDVSYQWRRNGTPLFDGPTAHGSIIQGSNTALLEILSSSKPDAGMYDVVVYNECGETVSHAAVLAAGTCGDISGDAVVNVIDLLAVLEAWGTCATPPSSCPADIAPAPHGDGVINLLDLLMVIENWG